MKAEKEIVTEFQTLAIRAKAHALVNRKSEYFGFMQDFP
jgi:hypothetical protein